MDEKEKKQEEEITRLMMVTFNFEVISSGKFIKCKFCNKKHSVNYAGQGLNEYMIQHYLTNHNGK